MLTFVLNTRKFRPFLYGHKFDAYTDHKSLTGVFRQKDPYGRLTRWNIELCQFQFKLHYIQGKKNVAPDSLSRNQDITKDKQQMVSVAILAKEEKMAEYKI